MKLEKSNLEADKKALAGQISGAQAVINYIDGLLAFMELPDPAVADVEPPAEEPVV